MIKQVLFAVVAALGISSANAQVSVNVDIDLSPYSSVRIERSNIVRREGRCQSYLAFSYSDRDSVRVVTRVTECQDRRFRWYERDREYICHEYYDHEDRSYHRQKRHKHRDRHDRHDRHHRHHHHR